MTKTLTVTNERVDDIPLLLVQLERMRVQQLLERHFPTHGNWQGLSLGWVAVIWLSYILSQADHRLSYVEAWADKRLETLSICTGQSLRTKDFSDDRLEAVLRYLSDDESWRRFETELGGSLLRVYDLNPERVRLDSTTASGYFGVTEEGLFQWGHSKDHRPDLAQVKLMLSTLDPLGMPIATEVLAGNKADDPLYLPAIADVRETLNQRGLLYIGDCKMAAVATRGQIEAGDDYYLCPLSATQLSNRELESYLEPVWTETQELTSVDYAYANGKSQEIAVGYERSKQCTTNVNGHELTWTERRLVVRSLAAAAAAEKSLRTRLSKAQIALAELGQPRRGKKKFDNLYSLIDAAEQIIESYRVQGLLHLDYQVITQPRLKRGYRDRPTRIIKESDYQLKVTLDEDLLNKKISLFGWRVYVTNHPQQHLSLADVVRTYRDEYLMERGFGRFKGKPLSLTPMYLQREDHIKGLIRLLSIGLRVLTLLEFQVRRHLAIQQQKLSGLYAGNPKRATNRPTAEQLLAAFKEITLLTIVGVSQIYVHLNPLSPLQQQILALLEMPVEIYTQLAAEPDAPP